MVPRYPTCDHTPPTANPAGRTYHGARPSRNSTIAPPTFANPKITNVVRRINGILVPLPVDGGGGVNEGQRRGACPLPCPETGRPVAWAHDGEFSFGRTAPPQGPRPPRA